MSRKTKSHLIGLICLALLVASCRRLPLAGPTLPPTITPTPRSTALPPVPTPIPVGSAGNPLHMEFVQPSGSPPSASAVSDLQQAIRDGVQMTITLDMVNGDAEALAALCASPNGTVAAAWLSGLAYAAAYAQGCGNAALQVQRNSRSTGDQARIIVTSSLGLSTVSDLAKHSFCRLGYSDVYSWLIPSLMLQAGGLSDSDLKSITDYTDASTMIDDVASGKCDAAGIAGSQFDQLASDSSRAAVKTLQQSVTIPYAVLVMPPQLPLAQQQQVSNALIMLGNGTHADLLKPLLSQDQLLAVTDADLSSVRSFVTNAGINLAQAGS